LEQAAQAARQAGARVLGPVAALSDPAGGLGLSVVDGHGRVYQLVHGDHTHPQGTQVADKPIRLAHAVLNTHDVPASQTFLEQVLDFSLSDRTRIMAFMRCNSDHHSIAFGDTDNDALNHIAFLMPDLESVMRGGGRLKDAGHPIEWGPGRHGPGNNAFNYFIGPFGIVVEYTAEVQQIDDSYTAGQPENWKWPAGRVDQWGISQPPSDALKQAQRAVLFAPV
jgi:catechol-2,3-dioxygenase